MIHVLRNAYLADGPAMAYSAPTPEPVRPATDPEPARPIQQALRR